MNMESRNHMYTFVFEWNGGTFISQLNAETVDAAFKDWSIRVGPSSLKMDRVDAACFSANCLDVIRQPVAISGVRNVWCSVIRYGENEGLLNIVKSSKD